MRLREIILALAAIGIVPASAIESVSTEIGLRAPALAARPAPPSSLVQLERVATGLSQPLFLTTAPHDARLFVVEKTGRIRLIIDGQLRAESFLDLSEHVDPVGEWGLLGLAFDPDYENTGRFYVCYSDVKTTDTIVARFQRDPNNPNRANATSREILLKIPQLPERADHKAGWLGFRPGDINNLYITTGDGGGSNDPDNHSQNLGSLLGKILRIDVSSPTGYQIPEDNPFVRTEGARPEIWAYGLRNPYRISFDRVTGEMFIGDVGQDHREEVNYESADSKGGLNFGWRQREGSIRKEGSAAEDDGTTPPILEYAHESMMTTRGCVIGGYVYRGIKLPELTGKYFFSDFSSARVYSLKYDGDHVTELTDWTDLLDPAGQNVFFSSLSSFGEDTDGELYIVDFAGSVYRLSPRT